VLDLAAFILVFVGATQRVPRPTHAPARGA
jgi:hypothetical protein